jgi:putative ABC transport system permease protein
MNGIRLARHSIRSITRFKLRTGFMMLGSLVGVAALTLVVSAGEGAERKILTTIRQIFGDSSIVVIARGSQLMGGPRPDAARLTLDDLDAVAAEVPEVDLWDGQQTMPEASVRHGDAVTTARVLGGSERAERAWSRGVTQGEFFDATAVRGSDRVALIGETVARMLFDGQDPLNADIQVGAVTLRVIGVLERFGTDVHGIDRDNEVVVPISTMMRRLMNVDTISVAKILVKDVSRSEDTAREIRRVLRGRHAIAEGQPDDFTILTPFEVQRMVGRVQRILVLYLPLVGGIALFVGGIVAATLMLASVSERVGEIGLRRAVGATPRDIWIQFLVETAATVVAGGIGGIMLGYAGAQFVASRLKVGDIFSWKAVLLGLGVSVATGLIAGLVPARRAARMPPAEALR